MSIMAHKRGQTKQNIALAFIIVLTVCVSLVGSMMVMSGIELTQDHPIGNAKVSVNVEKAPSIGTGHVSLFVLPKVG